MAVDTNSEEYKELMTEDKEVLVRLVIELQQIRKSQAHRLEQQERELDKYECMYLDQIINDSQGYVWG